MYCDRRMGGEKWYISPPPDADMRVPDEIRDCVVFLGHYVKIDDPPCEVPGFLGTAFWVSVANPSSVGRRGLSTYLVTAAHVAKALEKLEKWFVRINGVDGQAYDIHATANDRWYFHPDDANPDAPVVDIAILPFTADRQECHYECIRAEWTFYAPANPRFPEIGVGDEVFITGLFSPMVGNGRNLPIVRMGNIAMMPTLGELVPTDDLGPIEAYLIEARSIGGISGSPCFVRRTVPVDEGRERQAYFEQVRWKQPLATEEEYRLLGVMHGHWDIHPRVKNDSPHDEEGAVNLGIAIVIPASKIWDILGLPELQTERERAGEAMAQAMAKTTMDLERGRE